MKLFSYRQPITQQFWLGIYLTWSAVLAYTAIYHLQYTPHVIIGITLANCALTGIVQHVNRDASKYLFAVHHWGLGITYDKKTEVIPWLLVNRIDRDENKNMVLHIDGLDYHFPVHKNVSNFNSLRKSIRDMATQYNIQFTA